MLWLSEGIQKLVLSLPEDTPHADRVLWFLQELGRRCPNVKTLSLALNFGHEVVMDRLSTLLCSLRYLEMVVLPPCALSPKLITSLSTLPNLKEISYYSKAVAQRDTVWNFEHSASGSSTATPAFPRLYTLALVGSSQNFESLFRSAFRLSGLRSLTFGFLFSCSGDELYSCVKAVSLACPSLLSLDIRWRGTNGITHGIDDQLISLGNLAPITQLKKLRCFTLEHTLPLGMTDEELADLVSGCGSLTVLHLNCEPLIDIRTPLTLGVLTLLAQRLPLLRSVKLFIDASNTSSLPAVKFGESFRKLQTLCLGASHLSEPRTVAKYISRLLSAECVFDTSSSFSKEAEDTLARDIKIRLSQRRAAWSAVKDLLPLLIQIRVEEREAFQPLAKELDELRASSQSM